MIKKPTTTGSGAKAAIKWQDSMFAESYPTLHEYLTLSQWADRTPRMTATLTMYFVDGSMTMVVNDRDNERSAFFTASEFGDLMQAVETALRDDSAEWKSRRKSQANDIRVPF